MSTFSKTDTTAEAVRAVLGELQRLRTEGPTEQELQDTKAYFLGSFASSGRRPSRLRRICG